MNEMKRTRPACLVAVAAAACIGSPVSAQTAPAGDVRQVLPSMQVVRDPVTGRLRAPTHEEVAAQAASAQQRSVGGGHTGTALGEQRQIVFLTVAEI